MTKYPAIFSDPITSATNSEAKKLRSLHERKYRKKTGLFLAEGARICREAAEMGWNLHRLVFLAGRENDPSIQLLVAALAKSDGRALPMTKALLKGISGKDNPQILLGAFVQRWHGLTSVELSANQIWVALDRVRDPGNLGTIMRTADAVGAEGIFLIGDCTDPFSMEAVRASMGAVFNMKIIACTEVEFVTFSKSYSGSIIGTAPAAVINYQSANYRGQLIMLMGNEQGGLTDPLLSICSQLIKIPMHGRSDSLNLAVATGVTLYAALENRR